MNTGFLVEGVQEGIGAGDVDHTVSDRGRGHDWAAGFEGPLHAAELPGSGRVIHAGAGDIAVEGVLCRNALCAHKQEQGQQLLNHWFSWI